MKQRIFIYLFIFSALLNLFQYINSKRLFEAQDKRLETAHERSETYKDSLMVLQEDLLNLSHFNLEQNDDAMSYFENKGLNVSELIPHIKDELYKLNEVKGEHPLIPYAASKGRKMMINTVQLLNHKWIIADFTDGVFWGELFLTYEVSADGKVAFRTEDAFLYPTH